MKNTLLIILCLSLALAAYSQNYEWVRTGGGIGQDSGLKLAKDNQGNVYATGYFAGSALFESVNYQGRGRFDIFVAKYSAEGNLNWLVNAGGNDNDAGTGIAVDNSGNVYVTGYFTDNATFGSTVTGNQQNLQSQGNTDIFIAKYEPSGKLAWVKRAGGFGEDRSNDLALDKDGNIYITGYFTGGASFGSYPASSRGANDVFTAKYDNAGNCIWVQTFGGYGLDKSLSMDIDTLGNTFITGFFYYTGKFSNSNDSLQGDGLSADIFMLKYTVGGNLIVAKRMGGPYGDAGYGICVDKEGNFYLTGYFLEFAYFDTIVARGRGYDDIFLAKFDTNYVCQWAISEGGHHLDIGTAVDTDEEGNIYLAGLFDSLAWFGNKEFRSVLYYDVFVSKYSKKGILMWIKTGGGNDADFGLDVLAGDNKTLYTTGLYKNTGIFGNISTAFSTEADIFIAKLSDNIVGMETPSQLLNEMEIYPNPTDGLVMIKFNLPADISEIELFDAQGRKLIASTLKIGENKLLLHLENQSPGLYFIRVNSRNESFTKRVVKY